MARCTRTAAIGADRRSLQLAVIAAATLALTLAADLLALEPARDRDPELAQLTKSSPRLSPVRHLAAIPIIQAQLPSSTNVAWSQLKTKQQPRGSWIAQVDRRSGLIEIAEGAGIPWVPGAGNKLNFADLKSHLGGRSKANIDTLESLARSFVSEYEPLLGSSGRTLHLNRASSGPHSDYLWFLEFSVYTNNGLAIEGARIFFRVNNGNLVQFGAEGLPAPNVQAPPAVLDRAQALTALWSYLGGPKSGQFLDPGTLKLIVVDPDPAGSAFAFANGYELLPVWELIFRRDGRHETWRARVDAVGGEIVDFRDVNRYAEVTGGYWPVSWRVGGVEQPQVITGWPFATVNPSGGTSNTSGVYAWDGTLQTARHIGPFVAINDNCTGAPGTASSDGSGNLAFAEITTPNAPGDCQIQNGITDNTPAARQQYWHLNKIKEKSRAYWPANTWLQAQLTANVNIDRNCNSFWNGATVNFYTSGGGCGNSGEDAGFALHEWGHGMDQNDGNGVSVENGTGETYGDLTAVLQTLDSCIGQGFLGANCGGFGNACTSCDGVRDIDWGKHNNNAPMTVSSFTQPSCPSDGSPGLPGNFNGPCGDGALFPDNKEGHCESYVSSGALWDLAAADLQSGCSGRNPAFPDYNCGGFGTGTGGPYNQAGAYAVLDRLWYRSRPIANKAFTCNRTNPTWTSHGCNAGSNWKAMRVVDDDNGNLTDGTPHSCQLAAAFDRHGIACTTDRAYDVCFRAAPQPPNPTLNTPTPGNDQVTLDWTSNPSPDVIDVYRNQIGCTSGFTKIADNVSGTLYGDNQVLNGTTYYYQIVRQVVGNEAAASAPSNCVNATPTACKAGYVTDIGATISTQPDGAMQTISGNCAATTDCEDYFDISCGAGDTFFATFCSSGGSANFNTSLSAWSGSGFPTLEACNDDTCGLQSELTIVYTSAGTHRLRIGAVGAAGSYTMAYSAPAGCAIAGAVPVGLQSFKIE